MHDGDAATMMRYDANKKSPVVGYLLWWFTGIFGGHHFYMGRTGHGIGMLLLYWLSLPLVLAFIGIPGLIAWFVWWVIDAIKLNGEIIEYNNRLADELLGSRPQR